LTLLLLIVCKRTTMKEKIFELNRAHRSSGKRFLKMTIEDWNESKINIIAQTKMRTRINDWRHGHKREV